MISDHYLLIATFFLSPVSRLSIELVVNMEIRVLRVL